MRNLDRVPQLQVDRKGRNDFVTQVDLAAEREIIQTIHRAYPQHAILGEEGGMIGENEVVWIVDPLDGTTNFLHQLPHFAVSIGIQVKGRMEHGVVYAPCTQDLYIGSRGVGATLNNRKIRVSGCKEMDESLVGTGVPLREGTLETYAPMLKNIVANTAGIRRAGSAALDLAYVASGRLDAFWELDLKPWDIAAGMVLVEEAGGFITEVHGRKDVLNTGNILAATPKLHPALEQLLRNSSQGFVASS